MMREVGFLWDGAWGPERTCQCGCLGIRLNGKGDLDSFL